MGKVIFVIVMLAVAFFVVGLVIESDEKEIHRWAKEKGLEVKKIEHHVTTYGTPFYYCNRGQYIYEVDMTNGEKWWLRTSIFGNDWEQDK